MTIRYEANPPKTGPSVVGQDAMERFVERMWNISDVCGGIHITENVLGMPRISPVLAGRMLRDRGADVPMTVSMRVRDKTVSDIDHFVRGSIEAGFSGLLVVAGDRSPGAPDSGQVPSRVVERLCGNGVGSKIGLYLSVPAVPNYEKMGRKLRANPKGFITQVVRKPSQVEDIAANLAGYHIIPIVLFPSPKNQKAAAFLDLNMSEYSNNFSQFVKKIHDITGDVLLTSPGDYAGLYEFLSHNRF